MKYPGNLIAGLLLILGMVGTAGAGTILVDETHFTGVFSARLQTVKILLGRDYFRQ